MAELRQNNAPDISSVKYAIVEDNVKLSVFLKAEKSPPTGEELNIRLTDDGIAHEIIIDGEIVEENLSMMGKDENWLLNQLSSRHTEQKDVFLLTLNDADEIDLIRKEKP